MTAHPLNSTEPAKELVIFIHGTAAADVSDAGKRWWQFGSTFEQRLKNFLPPSILIDAPFHWSGENWERERREAGKRLLERLRELDACGVTYHLVGHSHGGSVILHSLRLSLGAGQSPLVGLRSWTTVGTPFLNFSPAWISRSLMVAAIVVAGLMVGVLREIWIYIAGDSGQWRNHLEWVITTASVLVLSLYGLGVASAAAVPLVQRVRYSAERARNSQAGDAYADKWIGLWHPNDEAINGLASSLGTEQSILPRIQPRRLLTRILLSPIYVYNWWIAGAGDQFIWSRIARKVQGNDIGPMSLRAVTRSPFIHRSCPQLPPRIVARMTESCDREAAITLSGVRELLGTAYVSQDAHGVVTELKTRLSWGAIIHTSYFDDPDLPRLVANWLKARSRLSEEIDAPVLDEFGKWLEDVSTNLTSSDELSSRFVPHKFNTMVSISVVAIGALLSIVSLSAFRTFTEPYTDRAQVDRIIAATADRELLNVHGKPEAGLVLSSLYAAGRIDDVLIPLDSIKEYNSLIMAARSLSESFGEQADVKQQGRLIGYLQRRQNPAAQFDALTIFIRHAPKRGNAIELEAFVARVEKLLGSISKVQQNILNAELAISYAKLRDQARSRKQAEAISLDRKDYVPCSSSELLLGAFLYAGLDSEIQQLFGLCDIAPAGQAALWRMAASASLADGFPNLALKAVQAINVPLLRGEPFVDAIQAMLAVGEKEAAQKEVRTFLNREMPGQVELIALAHSLHDHGISDLAKALLQRATSDSLLRARAFPVPGIIIRSLHSLPKAWHDFGDASMAIRTATLLKDVASKIDPKTITEAADAAELLIMTAQALLDIGLQDDFKSIYTKIGGVISKSDQRAKYRLWLALSELTMFTDPSATARALDAAADAVSAQDEYQTRGQSYINIASGWVALSNYERARVITELATVPELRLKGYADIVIGTSETQHRKYRRLKFVDWFTRFDESRVRDLERDLLNRDVLGFRIPHDPLPTTKEIARMVCEAAEK